MIECILDLLPTSRLEALLEESAGQGIQLCLVDQHGGLLAKPRNATLDERSLQMGLRQLPERPCIAELGDDALSGIRPVQLGDQLLCYVCGQGGESREHLAQIVRITAHRLEDLVALTSELDTHAEEIVRNYEELSLLYDVSHTLGGVLRIDEACELVLEQAMLSIGAEKASIMLLDKATDELYISTAQGIPVESVSQIRVKVGEGISGWVAANGEPLLVNDINAHSLPIGEFSERYKTESFLSFPLIATPMKVKREVVGVINMTDKMSGSAFSAGDLKLLNAIATQAAVAITNARLYDELEQQFFDTVEALASAIDARDPYTHGHSRRVTHYAVSVGRILGLSEDKIESLRLAALLHDIGKIGTPEHILLKKGRLSDAEWQEMRRHPECGAEIIQHIRRLRDPILEGVRHHHERLDGSGYPSAMEAPEISIIAKIISVADAFDAMTSDRPYRLAMTSEQAIAELRRCMRIQFDPRVVQALIDLCQDEADEGASSSDGASSDEVLER